MCGCLSSAPQWEPGLQPRQVPQTGNQSNHPLVPRPTLNPLSHTSQGRFLFFKFHLYIAISDLILNYLQINSKEHIFPLSCSIQYNFTINKNHQLFVYLFIYIIFNIQKYSNQWPCCLGKRMVGYLISVIVRYILCQGFLRPP